MAKAEKSEPARKKAAKTGKTAAANRQNKKIPGSFRLTAMVLAIFKDHWKKLGGLMLVYLAVNTVFANGVGNFISSVDEINSNIGAADKNALGAALNGLAGLLGGAALASSATQSVLIVIQSLAIIWALRHLLAGKKVEIKQAYYSSTESFIPYVIVVLVIMLQLLPLTLGMTALGIALSSQFSNDALVTVLFSLVFAGSAAWSLYMLSSSLLALYIVTLPNMHPRQALRTAKNLVKHRRWQLIRRVTFAPLFLLAVMSVVVLPLAVLLPWAAVVIFYILGSLSLLFIHTYFYSLYRSLI